MTEISVKTASREERKPAKPLPRILLAAAILLCLIITAVCVLSAGQPAVHRIGESVTWNVDIGERV